MVNGQRIILVGPQGIFKPTQIRYFPLSITTTTKGPYRDAFSTRDEFLLYRYRGTDPNFHENRKLRETIGQNIPLIYFHSTVPGKYLAIWPVFIVGDNPADLTFTVAADDALQLNYPRDDEHPDIRRAYVTREVRQRIHSIRRDLQRGFISGFGTLEIAGELEFDASIVVGLRRLPI